MLSDSFNRLPAEIQQIVLDGLDREIQDGFEKTEAAKSDDSVSDSTVRTLANGIARASKLRDSFTGDASHE